MNRIPIPRIPGVSGIPGGRIRGIRFTGHTGIFPITHFIKKAGVDVPCRVCYFLISNCRISG